mgnify:FL=1
MGETIGYCARRRDLTYHSDNCGTLIEGLKFKIRGMAVPVTLAEDMTPYTADMLHRKFGFCYIGMTHSPRTTAWTWRRHTPLHRCARS